MILFNPKMHNRSYPDERFRDIVIQTTGFLENKGLKKIKRTTMKRCGMMTSSNS